MTVTLLQLRDRAKQRSDMEKSNFVSTAEWNTYINASLAELHDILIATYGEDYYVNESSFSTTDGVDEYSLPADLYKIRGVDLQVATNEFYTLKKFNFNERNRFTQNGLWEIYGLPFIRYRLVGSKIKFSPKPDGVRNIKLWYYPRAVELTADTDTFDDFNGFSEYVVVDAAIKALNKEESDVSVLMAQKEALRQRIMEMAQNRDAGEPESVSDIYAENDDYYYTSRS